MTGGIEYKLWIDGKVVDAQFYTMIETITVEQGIDLATEARIELEMCADRNGKWTGPTATYAKTWKRVRIELRNQTSAWIPLIDGPIVSWDATASGEPGQSTFTLVAQDDTALLNRTAKNEKFENQTDDQVIRALFSRDAVKAIITKLDIDTLPEQPDDRPLKHIKRGTEMDMLRSIAEPYDLHVYVTPGDVGKSVGCVKRLSTDDGNLPVLQLNGPDRNVEHFQARNDTAKATRYKGFQLNIDDVDADDADAIVSMWNDDDTDPLGDGTPTAEDTVDLLGDVSTVDDLEHLGVEILSPFISAFRNVEELVERWQQRSSYTITATGSVRYGCYDGVLRAYDVVGVTGVPERLCTNFIVREVTHTLSRSEYRQDFTLMTNATATVQQHPGNGAVPSNLF